MIAASPSRRAKAAFPGGRRILDPFDTLRATRALAPHNPALNDIRWLIGEALRRTHHRADFSPLQSLSLDTPAGVSSRRSTSGLPASEAALRARDKLRAAETLVGPAAWPILRRILIEDGSVADCRLFVSEIATPWRADAIIADRLRVALDRLGPLLGVTAGR